MAHTFPAMPANDSLNVGETDARPGKLSFGYKSFEWQEKFGSEPLFEADAVVFHGKDPGTVSGVLF